MANVTLLDLNKRSIELLNPKVELNKRNHKANYLRMSFQVSPDKYKQIKSTELFNLYDEILVDTDLQFLDYSIDVYLELFLRPDLVEEFSGLLSLSDPGSSGLRCLEQLSPDHALLKTDSWLLTSIRQIQANREVYSKTIWAYLCVHEEQDPLEQDLWSILSPFLQRVTESSLTNMLGRQNSFITTQAYQRWKSSAQNMDEVKQENVQVLLKKLCEELGTISPEYHQQEFSQSSVDQLSNSLDLPKGLNSGTSFSTSHPSNLGHLPIEEKRLSQSTIWDLQRQYYLQQGNTIFLQEREQQSSRQARSKASHYAQLIFSCLRDYCAINGRHKANYRAIDASQKIYLVELGAGSGQFAYQLLHHLLPLLTQPALKKISVCYVLTDFVTANIEFWKQHPTLQPLFREGTLDIAYFDIEHPTDLTLQISGDSLTPDTLNNPIILIANQVLSKLPQDAFCTESGKLSESRVRLFAPAGYQLRCWRALGQIALQFSDVGLDESDYYEDAIANNILYTYSETNHQTHFLFPTVALSCLDYFRHLSKDRLMLISSDFGYCHQNAWQGYGEPVFKLQGSVSLPVNYHVLAAYTLQQGGLVLQPHRHTPDFYTQALLFGKHPTQYPETQLCYQFYSTVTGTDSWQSSVQITTERIETLSLSQLIGYLHSHHWDSQIFLDCFSSLLDQLDTATPAIRFDLIEGIHQIWTNYYPIGENQDLAFYLGMVLYQLAEYADAIDYFEKSIQLTGTDPATLYNISMCHFHLQQLEETTTYLQKALQADPSFEEALIFQRKLTQQQSHLDSGQIHH